MKKIVMTLVLVVLSVAGMWAGNDLLTPQVQMNGRYGYVTQTGVLVIPARYDAAHLFKEGLAAVEVAGKWGFIDMKGRYVVKPQYGYASDFSKGHAIVQDRKTKLYGAVNPEGELEVPCEFGTPDELQSLLVERDKDGNVLRVLKKVD